MNDLLVMFFTYGFKDEDKFEHPNYICTLKVKSYDRFLNFIKAAKGESIVLKGNEYTIDDIIIEYDGEEYDIFHMNVYCWSN